MRRILDAIFMKRDLDRLHLAVGGHIFFQTVAAAVRLDLFTLLSTRGPMSRAQIAKELGIADQPARILLLGLTSLKLIHKSARGYRNSRIAERLLSRTSPANAASFVELEHHIVYKPMFSMYEAIVENRNVGLDEFVGDEPTLYQRLAHHGALEQLFQDAMQALSVQANKQLARFVDFSRVRHVVDVGGGDGTNIIELARRWPRLRATVFDSPSVCQIARENIRHANLTDRLDAVAGNCFSDDFPKGIDCLLFCHFFTIWSPQKDQMLLRKCHDALPDGGTVMVFNMMQHDDETGPLTAAIGSPYFLTLATGEGMLYTWREYEDWMRGAGFKQVRRQALPQDHGVIVGVK